MLYNDIARRIAEMSSAIDYDAPEMIEHALAAYARRESRRKGGAPMTSQTKEGAARRRLKPIHYKTADGLRWIERPMRGWPEAPRDVRRKASLWLGRLAKAAGISRQDLGYRQMYLEAVRALISATGTDDHHDVQRLQRIACGWYDRSVEEWNAGRFYFRGSGQGTGGRNTSCRLTLDFRMQIYTLSLTKTPSPR